MERFAQLIPLNIQEIFTWYFEQKGVENPERFLGINQTGVGVNGTGVNNNSSALATPNGFPEGTVVGVNGVNGVNENELNADSQAAPEQPLQELPQEIVQENTESVQAIPQVQAKPEQPLGQLDKNTLQIVLQILTNFIAQKGKKTDASDFINVLSEIIEEK